MLIRELIKGNEMLRPCLELFDDEGDEEILDMPVDCGCGEECAKVLREGAALLESLADVRLLRPDLIAPIHQALVKQVQVFYFG